MMSENAIQLIIDRVSYPGFSFRIGHNESSFYLQIEHVGKCNVSGAPLKWKSRKWLLSKHMTTSEIVQTAFKAVMTALEHEARERFSYRGAAIFHPHWNVERLVSLVAEPDAADERELLRREDV